MDDLTILLSCLVCTFLLSGLLLWLRREDGDRSRRFLCYTWFFLGGLMGVRLLTTQSGLIVPGRVLPPENLLGGIYTIIILYLYPIEAINSGWLTKKRLLLLFFPGIVMTFLFILFRSDFRDLKSFQDLLENIGEFNVWIRVVILFMAIFPYTIMLFLIPYNWMKSRVYNRWITFYTLKIQLIGILYIIFMLTGSSLVSAIHIIVCIYLAVSITYQEIFDSLEMAPTDNKVSEDMVEKELICRDSQSNNPLVAQLCKLMDEKSVWKNPDLTLPELALLLNTNRNYLSKAIQDAGYKNFSDIVNRRRVIEFMKIADAGGVTSIQETFFNVGFRSRETALRCFKKYTGMLPTDYVRSKSGIIDTF